MAGKLIYDENDTNCANRRAVAGNSDRSFASVSNTAACGKRKWSRRKDVTKKRTNTVREPAVVYENEKKRSRTDVGVAREPRGARTVGRRSVKGARIRGPNGGAAAGAVIGPFRPRPLPRGTAAAAAAVRPPPRATRALSPPRSGTARPRNPGQYEPAGAPDSLRFPTHRARSVAATVASAASALAYRTRVFFPRQ